MARCAASIDLVAPIDFYGSLMVSLMTISYRHGLTIFLP